LKANSDYEGIFVLFSKNGSVKLDLDFSFELSFQYRVTDGNFLNFVFELLNIDHQFNKLEITGGFIEQYLAKQIVYFRKTINTALNAKLTLLLKEVFGKINSILENQIEVPGFNSNLAIKFLEEPIFTEDFFEIDLSVEFQDKVKRLKFLQNPIEKIAFKDLTLDLDPEIKDQLRISLDKNLMNDFASVGVKSMLNLTITNDVIPKEFPFKLNTLYFQALLPEMYERYPNKDLVIYIGFDSYPLFNLNSTDTSVDTNIILNIAFSLVEDPNNILLSLSTNSCINIILDSSKEDDAIHFSVNKVEMQDVMIIISVFDDLSPDQMKQNMNTFFASLIYFVNNYLRIYPIKVPVIAGVHVEKINLNVIEDKYLQVKLKPALK
jgi:hypothetical protein